MFNVPARRHIKHLYPIDYNRLGKYVKSPTSIYFLTFHILQNQQFPTTDVTKVDDKVKQVR